jgi:pSer/pThr/pTyr-binding forkhead associated (FHA) protein
LLLVDLGSANGTLVNGVPALPDEPIRLSDGDELQFGQVLARYSASKKGEGCTWQISGRSYPR